MNKLLLLIITISSLSIFSQTTRKEYINKYSGIAVTEMKRTGIPASITIAQDILESGDRYSVLAKQANNHFGIKCHSSWKGPKVYKDDDKKDECFRKYKSVKASYDDHSNFLVKYSRYDFLFELKSTDYKGWARGLKKAGYATNPKYPQRLIKIIEDNKLFKYDSYTNSQQQELIAEYKGETTENTTEETNSNSVYVIKKRPKPVEDYEFQIGYDIYKNNNVKFVIAKKGDTFKKLTKKLEKMFWELPKYNELDKKTKLKQGQIIYIQPKRNKAEKGKKFHIVSKGENIYTISQMYAIKTKQLRKLNNFSENQKIKVGDRIKLRKH